MRITLVNPAPKIWIKSWTLPLGLGYIAAVLEKDGHEVKINDINIDKLINVKNSDIVGITATTPLITAAWNIAKIAKESGALVVLGGPHPTILAEESLNLPYVDFVVRGEGEETVKELCKYLKEGNKKFNQIKGLSFKDSKGKIYNNPPREFIKNVDEIPFPAYHLFPINKYSNPQPLISSRKPAINIMTSRGCPFNCYYCYKGVFGNSYRPRTPENIIKEWEMLIKKFKVKELGIQDDAFNINIDRCKKIFDLIIEKKLTIPWSAPNGVRLDLIDEEFLTKMRKAGCYKLVFGVESGNEKIQQIIGKKLKLNQIYDSIKTAKKFGFTVITSFMIGNIGEDEETINDTIKVAVKSNPDFAQFCTTTPFPGTRLYDIIKKDGKFLIKDWDDYSQFNRIGYFEHGNVNEELIIKMVRKAYRKFYFRFGFLIKFITRIETWKNIPNIINAAIHFLFKSK